MKSATQVVDILTSIAAGPGSVLVAFATEFQRRRFLDQTRDICLRMGGTFHVADHHWTFPNGARLCVNVIQSRDSLYYIRGQVFHSIYTEGLDDEISTQLAMYEPIMILELTRNDLKKLLTGTTPSFEQMAHPIVQPHINYYDQYCRHEWHDLDRLTDAELWTLYLICNPRRPL